MSTDQETREYKAAGDRLVSVMPFLGGDPFTITLAQVQEFYSTPSKSGARPGIRDAFKYMQLCASNRLDPRQGDCYLLGYDDQRSGKTTWTQITAHQVFLKRAEVHPEFDGFESGIIVRDSSGVIREIVGDYNNDDEVVVGGWCRVFFKTRKYPMYKRLKLSTFSTGQSRWNKDPAGMIVKCFDVETEVLTSRGFEKFRDVTGSVLQVTDRGLEVTDSVPFVQPYDKEMVQMDSDDLNFCVTPNHDMITTEGKVPACTMFENARSRPTYWIPRCVGGSRPEYLISDEAIRLAAAYLADGHDKPHSSFWISVSRPRKVEAIERLGMFHSRHVQKPTTAEAKDGTRTVRTKTAKQVFGHRYADIAPLAGRGKIVSVSTLLSLSRRQAKVFVDALIEFDGSLNKKTGVRRFYSSRDEVTQAFELAAVIAGYAVSDRKIRTSDIGTKDNVCLTISARSDIGVRRWNRDYNNSAVGKRRPGLEVVDNGSGRVWCVKVPSGVIVVRRNGFSMLCGNCAEGDALRSAFPNSLGGLFLLDEREEQLESPAPPAEKISRIGQLTEKLTYEAAAPAIPTATQVAPRETVPNRDEQSSEPPLEQEQQHEREPGDEADTPPVTVDWVITAMRAAFAANDMARVRQLYNEHTGPDSEFDSEGRDCVQSLYNEFKKAGETAAKGKEQKKAFPTNPNT